MSHYEATKIVEQFADISHFDYRHMMLAMQGHWRNFGAFLVAGGDKLGIKAKTPSRAVINFLDKPNDEQVQLVAKAIESGIFETEGE
jgi:hypothetical protein